MARVRAFVDAILDNPTHPRALQKIKEQRDAASRIAIEQEIGDARWFMRNEQGRRLMSRLIRDSGYHESPFSENAAVQNRLIGRRDLGVFIVNLLRERCFDEFELMQREEHERLKKEQPK